MKMNFDGTWDGDWAKDWKPLLLTDGKLDEEKIKNEMHDLVFIYVQISEVYDDITGGKLSKPMYYADTIISEYQEQLSKAYDEGFADASEETNDA